MLDLERLLDAVIFNFLVGNSDAHGKNLSLIYRAGEARFAPLYDVVSACHYPELTREMAMRIGREYVRDQVTMKNFEQLAGDAELAKPLASQRVAKLADSILTNITALSMTHPVVVAMAEQIRI